MVGIVLFFVVLFLFGLLSIFAGSKLFEIVAGAALFFTAFRYLTLISTDFKYVMTLALIAGFAGWGITRKAKSTALFVFGAIIGIMMIQLVLPYVPSGYPSYFSWAMLIVGALLGGFFVKDVSNIFLSIAVSFFGGYLLVTGMFMLIDMGMNLTSYASSDTVSVMYNLGYYMKDVIVPMYSRYILAGSLAASAAGFILQKKK